MKYSPSIRSANWLYLASIVLILTVGSWLQKISFGWGLLATEIFLILLPTLLLLRRNKLPAAATLRLQWPGWSLVALGLAAGAGLWLVDVLLNGIMVQLSGYTSPTSPTMYPSSIAQAVLVFVALALAPPLCEEILFRGYIQQAYESRGRKAGLVVTALLFAFYHFRFQGLLALFPIAFGLGFLRLRSGSIWPGIAAHFTNNALAAGLLIVTGLHPDWLTKLPLDMTTTVAGVIVASVSFIVVARLTRAQATSPGPISLVPPVKHPFLTGAALPLILVGILYVVYAGYEVAYGRFPAIFAQEPLTLSDPPWAETTTWYYEVRNALDERVGQAECQIAPTGGPYAFDCRSNINAFQVETANSFYQSGNYEFHLSFQWAREDLALVGGETTAVNDGRLQETTLTSTAGTITLTVAENGQVQRLPLPEAALMPDEWAWRLMALPFDLNLNQKAMLVYPSFWDAATQTNRPATKEIIIVVAGAEPLELPAGNFIAWRVKVGEYWTAWYDVNAPHTLLKYDAGFATYLLTDINP